MIKIFIIIFSIYFAPSVFSAESAPCGDYGECDDYSYDLYNNESLQKGLATYINYCYGCHSLKYSRWGRIAADLEIPEFRDQLLSCLLYTSPSPRDLSTSRMPSSA